MLTTVTFTVEARGARCVHLIATHRGSLTLATLADAHRRSQALAAHTVATHRGSLTLATLAALAALAGFTGLIGSLRSPIR